MTLEEAVKEFQGLFTIVVEFDKTQKSWAHAPNGEKYTTIYLGAAYIPGKGCRGENRDTTEEAAVETWRKCASEFLLAELAKPGKKRILYWRRRPEMEHCGLRSNKLTVYSRFAVG